MLETEVRIETLPAYMLGYLEVDLLGYLYIKKKKELVPTLRKALTRLFAIT